MGTIAQFRGTNKGLKFDGVDDYVSIPPYALGTNDFSFCAWIKTQKSDYFQTIVVSTKSDYVNTNKYFRIGVSESGELLIDANDGGGRSGQGISHFVENAIVNDNKWHHIACARKGGVLSAYIDGKQTDDDATNFPTSDIGGGVDDWTLGKCYSGGSTLLPLNGEIKEVQIWNKALTKEEVNHYMNGVGGNEVGLVRYWNLSEGEGTEVNDYSKNLSFDGVDDYVDCGTDSSLDITDNLTIEARIKYKSLPHTYSKIVAKFEGYFIAIRQTGMLYAYCYTSNGAVVSSDIPISANEYLWLSCTYNSIDGLKTYVNGELVDTKPANGTIHITTNPLLIGNMSTDTIQYLDGEVFDVRIWSRTLSQQEIQDNMLNNISNTSNLVAWYKFNEGQGTRLIDYSNNDNDGTINGATWVKNDGTINGATWEEEPLSALKFNQNGTTTDVVDTPFRITTIPYSARFKFKLDALDNKEITIGSQYGGSTGRLIFSINGTVGSDSTFKLRHFIGGSYHYGTTVIEKNRWYDVTLTRDSNGIMKTYLNGALDGEGSTNTVVPDAVDFKIGNTHVGPTYGWTNGKISLVEIRDRELTLSEIQSNINKELVGNEEGLVAYYKFTEGVGTILHDKTSSANHGTINGATWVTNKTNLLIGGEVSESIGNTSVSFTQEGTNNIIYFQNPRLDVSYTPYVATTSGTWQEKHPNAIRVYDVDGVDRTGYVNTGVTDWTNTYHAIWEYDSELGKPVVVMRDLDGIWKAKHFDMGHTMDSLGLKAGDKYTISWLQWTDNLSKSAQTGVYGADTNGTRSFYDGQSNSQTSSFNTLVNTWQRVYATFTVSDVRNMSDSLNIYMYGHHGETGTVKIADVQFETKDHATTFADYDRINDSVIVEDDFSECPDCLEFDGVDDFIEVYHGGDCDFNGKDLTFDCWYCPIKNTGTWQEIMTTSVGKTTTRQIAIATDSSMKLQLYVYANDVWGAKLSSNQTFEMGKWYHIAITHVNNEGFNMYINGVLDSSTSTAYVIGYNTDYLLLGKRYGGEFLHGKIKDVGLYNRALSNIEVQSLYDNVHIENGLIGHWKLDDGYGTRALDSSTNENHGTINGASWQYSYEGEVLMNRGLKIKGELVEDIEF